MTSIPLRNPEFCVEHMPSVFLKWLHTAIENGDGFICVSKNTADDLIGYISASSLTYSKDLKIGYFHHGSDFAEDYLPPHEISSDIQQIFAKHSPIFLQVGTMEPRKGHDFSLDAFEILWANGIDISLCFAGKEGWNINAFMQRLAHHTEFNKRLFWLDSPNDANLKYCYQHASALIFPSRAEGFGLPIVEAAQYGLPILCSDITIFREIAGKYASYFSLESPEYLADALLNWFSESEHPDSAKIPWLTWEQSAKELLAIVLENKWYKVLPATVNL